MNSKQNLQSTKQTRSGKTPASLSKYSITEIKEGLQRIKHTQMEVLAQLRKQHQQKQVISKKMNQTNSQSNLIDKKKLSSIQVYRAQRQLDTSRQSENNVNTLRKKIGQLQAQVSRLEAKQKTIIDNHNQLQQKYRQASTKLLTIQTANKQQQEKDNKWQNQYMKLKSLIQQERQISINGRRQFQKLRENNQIINFENQQYQAEIKMLKNKNTSLASQLEQVQQAYDQFKKKTENQKKKFLESTTQNNSTPYSEEIAITSQNHHQIDRKNFIQLFDKVIIELRKMNRIHDKFYQACKQYKTQFPQQKQAEEEFQLGYEKVLSYLQTIQTGKATPIKRVPNQIQQSAILERNKYDIDKSFRDDFKKLEKELFGGTNIDELKRQLGETKVENKKLKEQNKKMKKNLQEYSLKFLQSRSEGSNNKIGLDARIVSSHHKIQVQQKPRLSQNYKKSHQNQPLQEILENNEVLRQDNIKNNKVIEGLKIQLDIVKTQKYKLQTFFTTKQEKISSLTKQISRLSLIISKIDQQKLQLLKQNNQLHFLINKNEQKYQHFTKNSSYELTKLTKQLEFLRQNNLSHIKQHRQFIETVDQLKKLERELARVSRNSKTLDGTIQHLWEIKETQYSNINYVIQQLKAGNAPTNN